MSVRRPTCPRGRRPSRPRGIAAFAIVALAAVTTVASAIAPDAFPDEWFYSGAGRPQPLKDLEGKPAPELELSDWIGDEVSLDDLRGEVVIVDFWATWCGPCMRAIPKNVELVTRYESDGLRFVGVHDSRNGWDTADDVVQSKSINYPVAKDVGGASVKNYNLQFWPTYVAIDRTGTVRAAGLRPDKVEDVIKVLLAEPRPAGTGAGAGAATAEAVAEFPAEWYDGGARRPRSLRAMEGKPAPVISAPVISAPGIEGPRAGQTLVPARGRVSVVHFVAGWSTRSMSRMPELAKQAAAMERQGITVLFLPDHKTDAAAARTMMAGVDPAIAAKLRVLVDAPPAPEAKLPIGRFAAAYGVRTWPTSVVIDRAGRVRAAGIKPEHLDDLVQRLMAERIDTGTAGGADSP